MVDSLQPTPTSLLNYRDSENGSLTLAYSNKLIKLSWQGKWLTHSSLHQQAY